MSEIFVSYSRRDTETVDKIAEQMTQAGMNVWIDRNDIKAGDSWRVQIVEAIDSCDAFVLMLSNNSAVSVNVQKEISLASDSGRALFVVLLEHVNLPAMIKYQLAGLQFVDIQLLGFDRTIVQLVDSLQEHLKKIKPPDDKTLNQVELVIQGVNLSAFTAEKQEQLLAFISKLANTDQSQLKIANMTAGSVHVFIQMPIATAFLLKTMALNCDPRFKQMAIVSLRIAGSAMFVNTTLGILTSSATLSPAAMFWLRIPSLFSSTLGLAAGKLLTIFSVIAVVTGLGFFASSLTPSLPLPSPTSAPTLKFTAAPLSTASPISTDTSTLTPPATFTLTPTAEDTFTPTVTASPTSSPTPVYGFLDGVVVNTTDRVACRYGPGNPYLFKFEYLSGNKIKVYGKVEIQVQKNNTSEIWLYGLAQGFESSCWVNSKYIQLNGDLSILEPYYPDSRAPLISFSHPRFPPPENVTEERQGDQVNISWKGYTLALGDRESETSPLYLVEAWTCQGGKIVFTPIGAYQEFASVKDEAGCSEPSHGRVFVAHKDGYIGPVEIPWP